MDQDKGTTEKFADYNPRYIVTAWSEFAKAARDTHDKAYRFTVCETRHPEHDDDGDSPYVQNMIYGYCAESEPYQGREGYVCYVCEEIRQCKPCQLNAGIKGSLLEVAYAYEKVAEQIFEAGKKLHKKESE